MNTRVTFHFDGIGIDPDFQIINPPAIPCTGEVVSFDWERVIKDSKELKAFKQVSAGSCFIAQVLSKNYSEDEVEIIIILHLDTCYEQNEKRRRVDELDYVYEKIISYLRCSKFRNVPF